MAALILDEKWLELLGKKYSWQVKNATGNQLGPVTPPTTDGTPIKNSSAHYSTFLKMGHFCPFLRLFLLFLMFNWKKIVQWSLSRDSICEPLLVQSNRFINWATTTAKLIFVNNQKTSSCWESCHRRQQRHSRTRADLQLRLQASNLETWNL